MLRASESKLYPLPKAAAWKQQQCAWWLQKQKSGAHVRVVQTPFRTLNALTKQPCKSEYVRTYVC